jgi:hypothetical protein
MTAAIVALGIGQPSIEHAILENITPVTVLSIFDIDP